MGFLAIWSLLFGCDLKLDSGSILEREFGIKREKFSKNCFLINYLDFPRPFS
jgi:hypothetical protein